MLKDCIGFTKEYQECQIHASVQHVPASKLYAVIKSWPFRGWVLDVIGEIRPTTSKQQKFILVGIDYFMKWIKVVPLVKVDQEVMIEFIRSTSYIDSASQKPLPHIKVLFLWGKRCRNLPLK